MKVTIRCSRYNEVLFEDVKPYLIDGCQIIYSSERNGRPVGVVEINGICYNVSSVDEVVINNVRCCLAYAPLSYFDSEMVINVFDDYDEI